MIARPAPYDADMTVDIAVAALVRDREVLMVHRHSRRQAYPDRWALPGGHVETGESPGHAVDRECAEELGVRIDETRPIAMAVNDPNVRMHAFPVTHWTGEPCNTAPEEHDDLRWFTIDELANLEHAHPETVSALVRAIQIADVSSKI